MLPCSSSRCAIRWRCSPGVYGSCNKQKYYLEWVFVVERPNIYKSMHIFGVFFKWKKKWINNTKKTGKKNFQKIYTQKPLACILGPPELAVSPSASPHPAAPRHPLALLLALRPPAAAQPHRAPTGTFGLRKDDPRGQTMVVPWLQNADWRSGWGNGTLCTLNP